MPSIKTLMLAESISRNKMDMRYKSLEQEKRRLEDERKVQEELRKRKLVKLARQEDERKLKFLKEIDIPRRE